MMNRDELKKRIDKLSSAQRKLLADQLPTAEDTNGSYKGRRVVAYVSGDSSITAASLRDKLKSQLPAYMIPGAFVMLDEMPRLPNGKLNQRALPPPNEIPTVSESVYSPPQSLIEKQLVAIWEEVLDIHPVGIHDNFFEIGGDSILSIQIVARARKAGLVLGPNQLFEHQTIAELCLFIQPEKPAQPTCNEVSRTVPLTPIQHWFFEEHKAAPQHWNHVMMFSIQPEITASRMANAIEALVKHHDALRLTFHMKGGHWESIVSEVAGQRHFHSFDLHEYIENEQKERIASESRSVQQQLSLSEGPLFNALFFECQPRGQNQLILLAHHLLVDAVSWQIISDDLQTLLNKPVAALPKTTSYQWWSAHLAQAAQLGKFDGEIPFWREQVHQSENLPTDMPMTLPVSEESIETLSFVLDSHNTGLLLKDALSAYRMRPDEILITAFLSATGKWSGSKSLTLWFERHGRESPESEVDLTSTVGWFTALYPRKLSLDPDAGAGTILKQVKEQLRQVPNGGVGYGVLRYLAGANGRRSDLNREALVIFNYLGNQTVKAFAPLGVATLILSGSRASISERNSQLELNSFVQDGQLQMLWSFSHRHYRVATIERLIDNFSTALRELIVHCVMGENGGYTPSDFPEAGLSQDDLDTLLNKL